MSTCRLNVPDCHSIFPGNYGAGAELKASLAAGRTGESDAAPSASQPIDEVSVRGACLRLRPALITASVAILGLVPLLFSTGSGSEVQRPLAAVVVGGLLTSTTLTLLVLPALYKWFASLSKAKATRSDHVTRGPLEPLAP
jgi:hypothetical protein